MSTPETWRGVVVPNPIELDLLQRELELSTSNPCVDHGLFGFKLIDELSEQVVQRQPKILELVSFAIQYFQDDEADYSIYSQPEVEKFIDGFSEGLDFFIGCMTYVRLLREKVSSTNNLELSQLPISEQRHKRQVRFIRSMGSICDEEAFEEEVNIARESYADLSFDHHRFAKILCRGSFVPASRVQDDHQRAALIEGYYDGLEFGLQLYLVSEGDVAA